MLMRKVRPSSRLLKIDAVSFGLLHAAQGGQNVILFAHSFFGPFDGDLVVAGVILHPPRVIAGAPAEHFFIHYRDTENLAEEVDHLRATDR